MNRYIFTTAVILLWVGSLTMYIESFGDGTLFSKIFSPLYFAITTTILIYHIIFYLCRYFKELTEK